MNLSINHQELQDKVLGKTARVIFADESGTLYEIIPYDGRSNNDELSE